MVGGLGIAAAEFLLPLVRKGNGLGKVVSVGLEAILVSLVPGRDHSSKLLQQMIKSILHATICGRSKKCNHIVKLESITEASQSLAKGFSEIGGPRSLRASYSYRFHPVEEQKSARRKPRDGISNIIAFGVVAVSEGGPDRLRHVFFFPGGKLYISHHRPPSATAQFYGPAVTSRAGMLQNADAYVRVIGIPSGLL